MCELFALSSRLPTEVRFSLDAFSRHGGLAGRNKDGWGLAYSVDGDVRLVKEPEPAAGSARVRFMQEHPFAWSTVEPHTQGDARRPRNEELPAVAARVGRPHARVRAQRRSRPVSPAAAS